MKQNGMAAHARMSMWLVINKSCTILCKWQHLEHGMQNSIPLFYQKTERANEAVSARLTKNRSGQYLEVSFYYTWLTQSIC